MEQRISQVSEVIENAEREAAEKIKKILIDKVTNVFRDSLPTLKFRINLHKNSHLTQLEIAAIEIAYPKTILLDKRERTLLAAVEELTVMDITGYGFVHVLLMQDGLHILRTASDGVVVIDIYGQALYPAPDKYYLVFGNVALRTLVKLDAEITKRVEKYILSADLT